MIEKNLSKSITKGQSNMLKVIAIIFMIIDHVGIVVYPDIVIFRIIGRLALPIFVYQLVISFRMTKDVKKYMIRLWVFALVSQVPYTLLFDTTRLNVFFNLLATVGFLHSLENKRYINFFSIVMLILIFKMDYGLYLLLLALIFYYADNKTLIVALFATLNIIFIITNTMVIYQLYSMVSLAIIFLAPYLPEFDIKNKFFYWLYPMHLLILLVYSFY